MHNGIEALEVRGIAEYDGPQLSAVDLLIVVNDFLTERRNDLAPCFSMWQIRLMPYGVGVDYRGSVFLEKFRHVGLTCADAPCSPMTNIKNLAFEKVFTFY